MFAEMAGPIRIIGDPDNQFPDYWSSDLEVNIFYFLSVYGHVLLFIILIFVIEFCRLSYRRTVQKRVSYFEVLTF
jgi:hypothetical protein